MTIVISENYMLEHYGTKGMKWGVRKAQRINARRAVKGKAPLKTSQLVGNKATRGAAYVASFLVGSTIGGSLGRGLTGGNLTVGAVAGNSAGIAGIIATNKLLKSRGSQRILAVEGG